MLEVKKQLQARGTAGELRCLGEIRLNHAADHNYIFSRSRGECIRGGIGPTASPCSAAGEGAAAERETAEMQSELWPMEDFAEKADDARVPHYFYSSS